MVCTLVALPLIYVLSIGPADYAFQVYGIGGRKKADGSSEDVYNQKIYNPLRLAIHNTDAGDLLRKYEDWWGHLAWLKQENE